MKKLFLLIFFIPAITLAKTEEEAEKKQPKIGNFALPPALQPSPLFAFGQNIIEEGNFMFYSAYAKLEGFRKESNDLLLIWLYGITEKLSIQFVVPIQLKFKLNGIVSRHLEDIFPQLEYAFYNDDGEAYANQATVVASLLLPTGSLNQNPATGFGGLSLFTGVTASHYTPKWYLFTSEGFLFSKNAKSCSGLVGHGLTFLYQFGLGRNIFGTPERGVLNVLFELLGNYSRSDKLNNVTDPNSGGNTILLAPSLWYSNESFIIQVGGAFPVVQHLFGQQNKTHFVVGCQVVWKIV